MHVILDLQGTALDCPIALHRHRQGHRREKGKRKGKGKEEDE
jgi:hypothetical protein